MTPGVEFVSAQIIKFPVGPDRRVRSSEKTVMEKVPKPATAALDTCWYHDEAIRESRSSPVRD